MIEYFNNNDAIANICLVMQSIEKDRKAEPRSLISHLVQQYPSVLLHSVNYDSYLFMTSLMLDSRSKPPNDTRLFPNRVETSGLLGGLKLRLTSNRAHRGYCDGKSFVHRAFEPDL